MCWGKSSVTKLPDDGNMVPKESKWTLEHKYLYATKRMIQ
jgi:hypothetical protein